MCSAGRAPRHTTSTPRGHPDGVSVEGDTLCAGWLRWVRVCVCAGLISLTGFAGPYGCSGERPARRYASRAPRSRRLHHALHCWTARRTWSVPTLPVPPSGADSRADDNMADGALVGALSKRKSRGPEVVFRRRPGVRTRWANTTLREVLARANTTLREVLAQAGPTPVWLGQHLLI